MGLKSLKCVHVTLPKAIKQREAAEKLQKDLASNTRKWGALDLCATHVLIIITKEKKLGYYIEYSQ